MDHCVNVDATRRLVLECVETNAVHARDGGLAMCIGDGFELDEVEIRRLVQKKKGTGKRRKKRNLQARERIRQEKRKKREEEKEARDAKKMRVKKIVESEEE